MAIVFTKTLSMASVSLQDYNEYACEEYDRVIRTAPRVLMEAIFSS